MTRYALFLVLGLAACAPDPAPDADAPTADTTAAASPAPPAPDPLPGFARRATAVELGLDGYYEVNGTWQAGDTDARYTAYFDADTLRLIEAIMSRGEYGDATVAYYFDAPAATGLTPFYVVQDEQRVRLDPREGGRRDTIQTRAAFAADGTVVAGEQTVNGAPGDAPPIELKGLRNHARALAEDATARARPAL